MNNTSTKLSIIIVNWNTKALLEQCLNSITNKQQTKNNKQVTIEIIVVDNGSTDGSVEMVNKLITSTQGRSPLGGDHRPQITFSLISNQTNLGFAKANNQGLKIAKGEYIMLLNSDTIVKPGTLGKLINYLDSNNSVDVVGPRLLNTDGSPQANCGRFPNLLVVFIMLFFEHFIFGKIVRYSPNKTQLVDWLMGAAVMARKKVFDRVGGLDEKIFMYMEEVEWFYRVKLAGLKSIFYFDAEIIHLGRGSSKTGKTEPIINIFSGLLHFYKKHYSQFSQYLLLFLLKSKALMAILLGAIKNDPYLKDTYAKAFKIN